MKHVLVLFVLLSFTQFLKSQSVTNFDATSITPTTASLNGLITANSAGDMLGVKFYYDTAPPTSSSPHIDGSPASVTAGDTKFITASVSSLTANTHYYYFLRGIDAGNGYTAVDGSPDKEFYTEPDTQASIDSMVADYTKPTELKIYFTNGTGAGVVIVMKDGSTPNTPVDKTAYNDGSQVYGAGDDIGSSSSYVVYVGNGAKNTNVTITGLDQTKKYYVSISEYSGSGSLINYRTSDTQTLNTKDDSNLPVELINFKAINSQKGALLKWSTASEDNNDYFELQRSDDGESFKAIDIIDGAGNSNVLLDYSSMDTNPLEGVSYYRLKQVDFDGKYTFSEVLAYDANKGLASTDILNSYSNNKALTIVLNTAVRRNGIVSVFDLSGRLLQKRSISNNGVQKHILDISGYSHGIYILKVQFGQDLITKKVSI